MNPAMKTIQAVCDAEDAAGERLDRKYSDGKFYLYMSLVRYRHSLQERFEAGQKCDFCGDSKIYTKGLCKICATDQYA